MKPVTLSLALALALALALCGASKCPTYKEKNPRNVRCSEPMKQLVETVGGNMTAYPAMVLIPRCDSLLCTIPGHTCQPTHKVNKSRRVEIRGPSGSQECIEKKIEWHSKCECACTLQCSSPMVLDEEDCECRCDQAKKMECMSRMNQGFMWDWDKCECRCSEEEHCSTGEMLDKSTCKCAPVST